ncbi:FUSC family protein [Cnuibacter sp. UC19_7]|uniref:FUSC family protein n=1 Tax=Cnuibacter sp. UC19_7 TaxID=3350166 RepID=UPI003672CFBD
MNTRGVLGGLASWTLDLVRVRPAPHPRWPIATQAALAMALPVGLFTLLGQPLVGLQAAGGAFTALYLASASVRERARALPLVGLLLIGCAAAGALVAPDPAAVAVGLVVVTVVSSALAYAFALGPPGPVFFALVYGMATNVTAVVDGVRRVDPLSFLAVFIVGCLIAYAVAVAPLVVPAVRRRSARALRTLLPGPRLGVETRLLLVRVAIVAVVGTVLSTLWIDQERAYWAVCSGIAVIGVNAGRRTAMVRGSQRFVGTVAGAGLFALIALVSVPAPLLALVLAALQFLIELLVVRNYALALVFITPLVLLISSAAVPGADLGGLAMERVLDTLLGAVLGMLTAFIHPREGAPSA